MTFYAIAGAECGDHLAGTCGGYAVAAGASDTIVGTPTLAGSYCFQVDPVNGNAVIDTYGWTPTFTEKAGVWPVAPNFLTVLFMFRFTETPDAFDDDVVIVELGNRIPGGSYARRLVLNTNEDLVIFDDADDSIGATADNPYLAADTNYWMLWYVDLRNGAATRDILWVWKGVAWDKAIDVSGHESATGGGGDPAEITKIIFGTYAGKGLPTQGGPFWVDEMAVQVLNEAPNQTAVGSVTTYFQVPDDDGTVDQDFDTGAPDFNDVDEIPADSAATTDVGDALGEKNAYKITDIAGGVTPLVVQVVGQAYGHAFAIDGKTYIYDGTTRDYGPDFSAPAGWTHMLSKSYNLVNGTAITESRFNDDFEAGVEVAKRTGVGTLQLSQIGLEVVADGPKAVPGDFPGITEPRVVSVQGGPAIGTADPMVF